MQGVASVQGHWACLLVHFNKRHQLTALHKSKTRVLIVSATTTRHRVSNQFAARAMTRIQRLHTLMRTH